MKNFGFASLVLGKNFSLLLLVVVLFSACQTTALFKFEALNAPSVVLPPDVKTLGFVDRNIHFLKDTVSQYYKLNDKILKDTSDYSKQKAIGIYWGIVENLPEYLQADSIPFIRNTQETRSGERKYEAMDWELADSISKTTASDVLICLEDVQIYNNYTVFEDMAYYGITDINYFAVWRLYDPLLKKYYDERVVSDSLFSETESSSYQRLIEEKLPKRNHIVRDVSYEIGKSYAELLIPQWTALTRTYFIKGDDRFAAAQYYLTQNNWGKAIALWEEIAEGDNDKLAGRACYNLAFANEIKEDFKTANHWIRKSIQFYKKLKNEPKEFEKVKSYTLELVKRTQNKAKLNQFLGE